MLRNPSRFNGNLAGIAAIFLWALIPIIFKAGVAEYDASTLFLARFLFSLILFIPLFFRSKILLELRKEPLSSLKIGIALFICYYFFSCALTLMSASAYIIIYSLNPVISLLFLKVKLNSRLVVSIALGVLGIIVSLGNSSLNLSASLKGICYIVLGMTSWAVYTKLLIDSHKTYTDLENSFLTHFISFFVAAAWWMSNKMPSPPQSITFYGLAFAFAIISPLAYFCFSYALRIAPVFGILSQFLDPVVSLFLAVLFLQEKMNMYQFAALPLVFTSAYLAMRVDKATDTQHNIARATQNIASNSEKA